MERELIITYSRTHDLWHGVTTNITLPNPYTPMAYLAEDVAFKHTVLVYVIVGSFGALLWDVILHLPQDFRLATQYKINPPFIVYCISRLSSLAFVLALVIGSTTPIGDCSSNYRRFNFIYPVAIPSTLLLFVFRVCALYQNSKPAIVFFSTLWIGLLVCSIFMPFGVSGYEIGPTGYCVEVKSIMGYAVVDLAPFVHDTIIFFATSWAFVLRHSYTDLTLKNGFKVLVLGNVLPVFSRSILRDGQLYYLSTLVLNIILIISYKLQSRWLAPCTFGVPLIVLMNTLAGHIYRNTRFQVYEDFSVTTSVINKHLKQMRPPSTTSKLELPLSSPNRAAYNPHNKFEIVFRGSPSTTISTTADDRRELSPSESSSESGHSNSDVRDLEKQGGKD